MVNFKVLDLTDKSEWNEFLYKCPLDQRDIYFTPEYYHLYEELKNGIANCILYQKGDDIAMYPFLKNSVNELGYQLNDEYFDIQGVYGYNGIISNTASSTFLVDFFNNVDQYCMQNNIIVEFLRINPILNDLLSHRPNFEIIYDRDVVNIDLLKENIFDKEYEYSTRKNIRKAVRTGLVYKWVYGNEIEESDLASFIEIYNRTMDRNGANNFYYFNTHFFDQIANNIRNKSLFVFVLLNQKMISCELILLSNTIAYSFLGGTLSDYYPFRPNDFLKHESINLLKGKGFHSFLLGGGPKGVFNYKKSFSKNGIIPFHVGRKIHFKNIFNEVTKQWTNKYPEKSKEYKNVLLKYRF